MAFNLDTQTFEPCGGDRCGQRRAFSMRGPSPFWGGRHLTTGSTIPAQKPASRVVSEFLICDDIMKNSSGPRVRSDSSGVACGKPSCGGLREIAARNDRADRSWETGRPWARVKSRCRLRSRSG